MSETGKAVFLSYASQDAEAAKRIADALRAAGVEVWFDQSELVGGDAWDAKIRKQIKDCALLIPIISAATQARTEGYFRLEWRLADQRTHLMAKGRPFLLPVVIDDTRDAEAHVPDSFTEVQWTRLPGGEAGAAFAGRVKKMVGGEVGQITDLTHSRAEAPAFPSRAKVGRRFPATAWIGLVAVLGLGIAGWVGLRPTSKAVVSMSPLTPPEVVLSEAHQLLAKIAAIVEKDADAGREDWLLAENLGAQVVKLEPANAEAWAAYSRVALGRFLTMDVSRDTSFSAALQRARQAVALGSESTEAKLALALAYAMESKTRAEAEPILRPLLEQHPNDRRLWRARGTLAQLQKQYDEALTFYDRADALPGGDPVSCRLKAAVLSGLGRYDDAERSIERSLELRPGPAAHLMKLNFLATVRDDLPQACALLEKLPGSYFLRDDITYCAAQLWMWNREPAKAVRLLAGWRENYLGDSPKGTALGQAYLLMGRGEAAQQAWRSALALVEKQIAEMVMGSDQMKYYAKARLLALLGEKAAAEEAARLWEQSDANAVSGQNKAALLVLLGKNEEALAVLPKQPWNGLASHPGFLGRLSPGGASYRYDPIWNPLRGDPRFEKLAAGYRTMWGHVSGSKSATGSDAKSVAVLAFANLSDDKGNEYFSDGISEELLNVLAKVPGLKVSARTSAFSFKGKNATVREVGEKLGVAHVVEGSVQKIGNRVKITVRLNRASTNEELWAKSFAPMELTDVFAIQSEIAQAIVTELRGRLTGEAAATTAAQIAAQIHAAEIGGTRNAEAHELHLRGKFLANQFSIESLRRAEEVFRRAVALDPAFGQAWASLAKVGRLRSGYESTRADAEAGFELAREASARAVELAPNLAAAHLARLHFQLLAFDWKGAIESLRRAKELSPDEAYPSEVRVAGALGEHERAVAAGRRAIALDPVNPELRVNYAWALLGSRRFGEAESEFRRAAELSPTAHYGHARVGIALLLQGRAAEGTAEAARETTDWTRRFALALIRWGEDRRAESDAALEELVRFNADTGACQIGEVHAFRGESDRSFEWLERALRQRDPGLITVRTNPLLDSLRADARWPEFLKKIGLSDEQLK